MGDRVLFGSEVLFDCVADVHVSSKNKRVVSMEDTY